MRTLEAGTSTLINGLTSTQQHADCFLVDVIHALRHMTSYARHILDLIFFLERRKITQGEEELSQNGNGIYGDSDSVLQLLKENEKEIC